MRAKDLLRKRAVSGLGEDVGLVIHVEEDQAGTARRLWLLDEANAQPRLHDVKARFVAQVTESAVIFLGPRQGFHITRLMRQAPKPGSEAAEVRPLYHTR